MHRLSSLEDADRREANAARALEEADEMQV